MDSLKNTLGGINQLFNFLIHASIPLLGMKGQRYRQMDRRERLCLVSLTELLEPSLTAT